VRACECGGLEERILNAMTNEPERRVGERSGECFSMVKEGLQISQC
jgi:hypothetical protein